LLQGTESTGNGIEQITRVDVPAQLGGKAVFMQRVVQSDALRLTAAKVGHFVERHSVRPRDGHIGYVLNATPRHQEGLGDNLFGRIGPNPTSSEAAHVGMVPSIFCTGITLITSGQIE
jgi:hypothetical protein